MGKAPLQLLATTVAVIQLHLLLLSLNYTSSRQSRRKQTTAKLASRGETGRRRRSRRRPPPNSNATTQNRLPIGSLPADRQAINPHIRIIPRVPDRTHEQSFAEEPIFKHASLQHRIEADTNLPALSQTLLPHETRHLAAHTLPATFADMARPTSGSLQLVPDESLASSEPVPLTGLVKLKPNNRNKGRQSWRPLELTDLESSDENHTDVYPTGDGRSYTPQNAPADCAPAMFAQPTNSLSAVDPVTALAEHMDSLSRIFGERLPDSTFLTQNAGSFDNQIVFILHPNGDVQAHQWAAQSYQWVNLGQYSYRRKRIEGQLEKEKLRGQKIGGGLQPNTVQYFLAVTKQREQDCKNSSADQHFTASSLPQPEVPYPPLRVETESGRHVSLSSIGSSTLTALPATNATTATAAASRRHSSMSTNPFIDDPFHPTEFNEYTSSRAPANTDLSPLTQRELAGDHNHGIKVDKGKSVARAEQMDGLLLDRLLFRRPSIAIADSSVSDGQPEVTEKWSYDQDRESRDDAFQLTLLGNEPSRIEPASHNLALENVPPNAALAVHRAPAMNFNTTKHARQIVAPCQAEPLSTRRMLRPDGEVETAWHSTTVQKGAATSNMSNEELALYSKPTPQDWNGPFFPDTAPTASDLLTPDVTANKRSCQELAAWWHSGNMRERQEDYLKVLQKTATESSNDWSLDHALYPVFENLKAYVENGSHKPRDYFARFAKPPEWCINNTPAGRKSFFGEDYGTPPARLGRDPRYRDLPTPIGFEQRTRGTVSQPLQMHAAAPSWMANRLMGMLF